MKTLTTITTILTLALLASIAPAQDKSSAPKPKAKQSEKVSAAAPTDAAGIKTCIEQRLANAPSLSGQKITVTVLGKVPRLTGKVATSTQKGTATRIAKSKTCGGSGVMNDLEAEVKREFPKKEK